MVNQWLSAEDLLPLTVLPPRKFETKRLELKAIKPGDSKLLFDLYASDPIATKYMSFKCATNVAETEAVIEPAARYFLGESAKLRSFIWIIFLKTSGQPMGTVGFGPEGEFALGGGYILNPKFWGNGYATEAWSCIVEWAKTQVGVFRITASHHPDNTASGKVLAKAGMVCEGTFRRHSIYPNISAEPSDSVIYAWARK